MELPESAAKTYAVLMNGETGKDGRLALGYVRHSWVGTYTFWHLKLARRTDSTLACGSLGQEHTLKWWLVSVLGRNENGMVVHGGRVDICRGWVNL
jgi:hypothetical protein